MDRATLLLVEDDPLTRSFLADNLTADGYELLVCGTARDALRALEYHRPDLAVIDVRLPDGSGLDVIRRVRDADGVGSRLDPTLPLIVLSGCAGEVDRIRGFELGADDYVSKPFGYPELRLRIGAVLRRTRERMQRGRLRVGELEIDPASRIATLRGRARAAGREGVRAAAHARHRADTGVHEGRAPQGRLGLPPAGPDAHAGLARLPRPPQARARRGPVRRQRLGRRLPAH